MPVDPVLFAELARAQRTEITEQLIYERLAGLLSNEANADVLRTIAADEKRHHDLLAAHTGRSVKPSRARYRLYVLLGRTLGVTFALRLMEKNEDRAGRSYARLAREIPELAGVAEDEAEHEQRLLDLLDEERLRYASSVVLGLNDALVELTGAIAGYTLALRETRLISVVALVTGVSAALSMAASEYLSTKTDGTTGKHPLRAALYTGLAYVLAVLVLVLPFLLVSSALAGLAWTIANALCLILVFTFYISVAKGGSFAKSFGEMAAISLGVAAVSFGIGFVLRQFMGVD